MYYQTNKQKKANKMKKTTEYYIHPTTGEHTPVTCKEDKKRFIACGWRKVKKVPQYDVRTGKKIQ